MKKRIISLILTAFLVSSASISASATEIKNSNVVQNKEISQEKVKETLKNYFNKNLESEKQLKVLKNESIEKDSSYSLIVTQKVGSNVYVSAHTYPTSNVPITHYTASGTYSSDRLLSFNYD